MERGRRLPEWLKMKRASGENYTLVKKTVSENRLHTICTSGNCPNIGECWNAGTATFMILGDICTRACKFCGTATGKPLPPDPEEPGRIADSVRLLKLKHCVITSVDRDDLHDGGASSWAETVKAVKSAVDGLTLEVLIPDFNGDTELIQKVLDARPDVVSHNVETVRRLTPLIRTKAKYDTSLNVIKYIAKQGVTAKSGIMLGLGETESEIIETLADIRNTGCSVVTIGQYLKPSAGHLEPVRYYTPDEFRKFGEAALEMGFSFAESAPLVRSSFHAERHVTKGIK
jgi:lipoic acid synthetase